MAPESTQLKWKKEVRMTEYGAAVTKIDDIKDWNWVMDRVSFMKAAIAHMWNNNDGNLRSREERF